MIKKEILNALRSRYKADIEEASATINIYLNNSVGIGEHPQHLDEIDKLLDKIKEAEEKISLIERWVK